MEKSVQSPCVRNCCLNQQDICVGCGRTLQEITHWTQYSTQQQRQIVIACRARFAALQAQLTQSFK
ncbi:DUF1289 domain-containing protein [Saccharobesus litoralis]|uniref:DUF1289 domain-containing protein n=1 Tax=Saccharobesus litoralis TaxID=2172099 RepID=A0A2S0VRV2_9ALTE|nr:DUF1289 domain-containing protein [Saccharobesus litoralis]AWB66946.1 DUF1289 domain-containing protein [Saccharobesus litoralis]